eukprot:g22941.t1
MEITRSSEKEMKKEKKSRRACACACQSALLEWLLSCGKFETLPEKLILNLGAVCVVASMPITFLHSDRVMFTPRNPTQCLDGFHGECEVLVELCDPIEGMPNSYNCPGWVLSATGGGLEFTDMPYTAPSLPG